MSQEYDPHKLVDSIKKLQDVSDIYAAPMAGESSLYQRLQAHAKIDLQEVAAVWKAYAPLSVQAQPAGVPEVVRLANVVSRHFTPQTGYAEVNLMSERDVMVRSPVAGQSYKGPILGVSAAHVLQRDVDSGDVIVHARHKLVGDLGRLTHETSAHIRYPHGAIGLASAIQEAGVQPLQHQFTRGLER